MLTNEQKRDLRNDAAARVKALAARAATLLRDNTPEEAETAILLALEDAFKAGALHHHVMVMGAAADTYQNLREGAESHDMEGQLAPALATVRPMEGEAA